MCSQVLWPNQPGMTFPHSWHLLAAAVVWSGPAYFQQVLAPNLAWPSPCPGTQVCQCSYPCLSQPQPQLLCSSARAAARKGSSPTCWQMLWLCLVLSTPIPGLCMYWCVLQPGHLPAAAAESVNYIV